MKLGFATRRAWWEIETVPNWRCWMWAVRGGWAEPGTVETFWRLGPFHIQRFVKWTSDYD
jgi:hypothetical protein